ncbi:MAG: IS110 family transposase [Tepidiformaceae bacterium]
MQIVPVFVGLDYHSASVQVCVVDQSGRVLVNCKRGSSVLDVLSVIEPLGRVERVAIEACCGAADFGDHLGRVTGWRVSLAHTGLVARMRSSIDKTDRSDARVLADLCRAGYLPEVWLAPEPVRELRTLVRRRHQLSRSLRDARMRIKSLLRDKRAHPPAEVGLRWTLRLRRWLQTVPLPSLARAVLDDLLEEMDAHRHRLARLDEMLERVAAGDRMMQSLMAIKGVGVVTACTLGAVVGRFDRFRNGKQFARYCGLTPRNASSGERMADAGLIRSGNPELKTLLIQVAHRIVRNVPRWREMERGLMERGKPKCAAIVAVANRWTRRIWHDLKSIDAPLTIAA